MGSESEKWTESEIITEQLLAFLLMSVCLSQVILEACVNTSNTFLKMRTMKPTHQSISCVSQTCMCVCDDDGEMKSVRERERADNALVLRAAAALLSV